MKVLRLQRLFDVHTPQHLVLYPAHHWHPQCIACWGYMVHMRATTAEARICPAALQQPLTLLMAFSLGFIGPPNNGRLPAAVVHEHCFVWHQGVYIGINLYPLIALSSASNRASASLGA